MAFITPKNILSPLANKTVLFLWIFIALLFAVARSSGTKLTVQNIKTPQQMIAQPRAIAKPQPIKPQVHPPKLSARTDDSFLPFGFDGLNAETTPQEPTNESESLEDIYNQM